MIQNVKPIQSTLERSFTGCSLFVDVRCKSVQTEFDKLDLNGADKPRQTRFLRSQQDLKQKMEQNPSSGRLLAHR